MKRTISVVGSATASVEPDIAHTNCGVQVSGPNAQDVLRRANEALHGIIEAVVAAGVDRGDLRTRGPNLYPTEHGYQGSNDLAIVVRDLSSLGALIDTMIAAGGPNVTMHGVNFVVDDPAAILPRVRVAAIEEAHRIATQLASAAGAAVGEVVTINESSGFHAPALMAMETSGKMSRGTPVESGQQQLRVDVNVTYRLVGPA
jgi:uncharacterized protein YggE